MMDTRSLGIPTRQSAFDYDRTVIAFHGTTKEAAERLVRGVPFARSENNDDWLGHGIYFWEYAPQQAWWWAERRYGEEAAVVDALVRLGRCLDLLDPANARLLVEAHSDLVRVLAESGERAKSNANAHKYLDCAVFNYLFEKLERRGIGTDSARAMFMPHRAGGMVRLWDRSGVFQGAHIQLSVREPNNILAVWHLRKDGRYGRDGQ